MFVVVPILVALAISKLVRIERSMGNTNHRYVDIVFEGGPGPVPPRFVEVEDNQGHSVEYGKWVKREDGYWVLRIEQS